MNRRARRVRSRGRAFTGLGLAALAALALGSCASDPSEGYSFSSSHATNIATVHVPMFKNPTFHRGLEVELTDAIIKEIQRTTPWKVASDSVAETSLGGTITDVSMRRLSSNRDSGLAQELAVSITVDFDWIDVRTGKTLASRRSFSASETFVPTKPVGERLEVGEHAAVQQLARDIVAELRSGW
jgi:hypothetical protein